MSFPSRRTFSSWNTAPVDNGTSQMKITRGMIERGLLLSVLYSVNVTGAGAAVRYRSLPIKRITLYGTDNKAIKVWKPADLVNMAIIFEQTPSGSLIVPASAAAIANYTNLEAHVPLFFSHPHAAEGDLLALATFMFQELTLEVQWGTVSELFTTGGALAGAITFTANGQTVTQIGIAGLGLNATTGQLAARALLGLGVDRYVEVANPAVAQTDLELKIGNTANLRAIILTSELTSTGEPTDTIINSLRFTENNTVNVNNNVPWKSLKAENARLFGLSAPTGVAVLDFAEDGDIRRIYPAKAKDAVAMYFNTAAIAGNIRAALLTVEPLPY